MTKLDRLKEMAHLVGADCARDYYQKPEIHSNCGDTCSAFSVPLSVKMDYLVGRFFPMRDEFIRKHGLFKDDPELKAKVEIELTALFSSGMSKKMENLKKHSEKQTAAGHKWHCGAV